MIDNQNNQFDNHEPDPKIIIKSKYEEREYIFNYIWEMLKNSKNMIKVKNDVDLLVNSNSLLLMYDGLKYKINIRTRFIKGFLMFYKANTSALQIKKLHTDINERRKLAMTLMDDFRYNGHQFNLKTLLKMIKEIF